jgi:hypothetical protein
MLDWLVHQIIAIVTYIPALIVAQDSLHFYIARAMFALLLIVLVMLVVALRAEILSCITRLWKEHTGRDSS